MKNQNTNAILIAIPKGWAAVSVSKLLPLFALSLMNTEDSDFRLEALRLLVDAKVLKRLSESDLVEHLHLVDWVFEAPILDLPTAMVRLFDVKWGMIPMGAVWMGDKVVKVPFLKRGFLLPKSLLDDVTMEELVFGMAHLIHFGNDPTREDELAAALATFIRPKKSFLSNKRAVFDETRIKHDKAYFEELPTIQKLLFYRYISDNVTAITQAAKYKVLFGGNQEGEVNPPKSTIWLDFAIDAAGLPNLGGDVDVLMKKNIHIVLSAVAEHRRQQNRMAREHAANMKQ